MSKKFENERAAERLFNKVYKIITKNIGKKSTYSDELEKICVKLFGKHFRGVYPSDKIPKLNMIKKYCILNLDNSKQPGSHWVGLARIKNKTYFYDSFARKSSKIIPKINYSGNGRIIQDTKDKEQDILEESCGQYTIAWLYILNEYGAKVAMLI